MQLSTINIEYVHNTNVSLSDTHNIMSGANDQRINVKPALADLENCSYPLTSVNSLVILSAPMSPPSSSRSDSF